MSYVQLFMRRPNLEGLPPVYLPAHYTLRTFQPNDAVHWEHIIDTTFEMNSSFANEMESHPYFAPEKVFFICHNDIPVATAAAWNSEEQDTGYVHMVGSLPEYKGKGLGYQVSLATLHQMRHEGKEQAVLQTDDFRLPAIVTYLKLGFVPEHSHPTHAQRWEDIAKELGRPIP